MAMCSPCADAALPAPGLPIRESTDQRLFNVSPWLIAVVHALHRLLVPRHPPCALDILTVIYQLEPKLEPEMKPNSLVKAPAYRIGAFGQLCGFQGPEEERSTGDSRGRSLKTQQCSCAGCETGLGAARVCAWRARPDSV